MITRLRTRAKRRPSESGVALVMVLGIMMVGAVITTTLVMVTLYNSQTTVRTRLEMQALASADAGIDLMLDMFNGKTYAALNGVCGQSFVINDDAVAVTTKYTVDRSGTIVDGVSCPSPTDITRSVEVTSTATTADSALNGGPTSRTVIATFMPTPPEVTLDKAIFSEGSTTITNNSKLYGSEPGVNDAHIYSNGGVTCKTQVDAGGSIYAAQGDVIIENTCEIGNSVWASGKVTLSSQSSVDGNVYAASADTYGISLANNNSYIGGSALTNGGIFDAGRLSQGGGILRTAFARTGAIVLDNQGDIGGSAYAKGDISFNNGATVGQDAISTTGKINASNNGNKIGGNATAAGTINTAKLTITGTTKPNTASSFPGVPNPSEAFPAAVGYPTNIQAPPREQLPVMNMTTDDIALWEASGWIVERYNNKCSGTSPQRILTGADGQTWSGAGRLIIFENCTGPVTFNSNDTLYIGGNTAMVSNTGFYTQNLHKVYSSTYATDPATRHDIFWIVPADAPGVSWNSAGSGQTTPSCTSPAGNITVDKLKVWSINLLWYTPCTFSWSNGTDLGGGSEPFTGQIYAGKVNLPNATEIKMNQMPVPSLAEEAPDPTSAADIRMLSRFDEHG